MLEIFPSISDCFKAFISITHLFIVLAQLLHQDGTTTTLPRQTTTPLQYNHYITTVQPLHHHSTTTTPPRYNYYTTTAKPLHHHSTTTTPPRCNHYTTTAQQLQHHSTTTTPPWHNHYTTTVQSLHHHGTTTIHSITTTTVQPLLKKLHSYLFSEMCFFFIYRCLDEVLCLIFVYFICLYYHVFISHTVTGYMCRLIQYVSLCRQIFFKAVFPLFCFELNASSYYLFTFTASSFSKIKKIISVEGTFNIFRAHKDVFLIMADRLLSCSRNFSTAT